jgi:hypothetical protein
VSQRDDFTQDTIRKLGERVSLHCTKPDCRAPTKGPHTDGEKAVSVGKACHIHAASPGGPRYDASQSEEERRSIDNGIWLCSNCGTLIDTDAARFPALMLREWKMRAELEALANIGKPATNVGNPVLERLEAIPSGAVAKLVYLVQNTSDHVHDKFQIEIIAVDRFANVLRFKSLTGNPGAPDSMPLGDIEDVWEQEGSRFLRIGGFMDFNAFEPYRYKSRPARAAKSAPASVRQSAGPGPEAEEILAYLVSEYVKASFPNHKVWTFTFPPSGERVTNELRALGLIETMGARGRDGTECRLTDIGQRWIMSHRG